MKECGYKYKPRGCTGGWKIVGNHPVLGPGLGTVNDPFVIKDEGIYKMWFSWRKGRVIAYTESKDGVKWDNVQVVLIPVTGSDWEGHEVCRPTVIKKDGIYHMWYTGMMFPTEINSAKSCIGYAQSQDGILWNRKQRPVMIPDKPWEKIAVSHPHVIWDAEQNIYKMWYSAGRQHETDAIGYAESTDGLHWQKNADNPVVKPVQEHYWEMGKVLAPYVIKKDEYYYMFYQGMDGDLIAGLGLARSKDGIYHWERYISNPILAGVDGNWDWLGTRKVSITEETDGYQMWYTGGMREGQAIGLAFHPGTEFRFEETKDARGFGRGLGSVNYYYRDHIAKY